MKCRLCQQDAKLCDSHIIPEFLYRPSYDDKHRAKQLIIEPLKSSLIQKGFREKLLCADCESRISKLETYVSKEWKKAIPAKISDKLLAIKGLDYARFKLFHLSILWRSSISSRQEFSHITLGPHEEIIRKMLIAGDPGPDNKYCFFAKILVHNDEPVDDLVYQPIRSRLEAHWAYVYIFGSCLWHYLISSHSPQEYLEVCFSKKGEIILLKEEITDNNFIRDFARRLQESKKTTS